MAAYSHPRKQQSLPPGQQGDFSVGFLNMQQTGATWFWSVLGGARPQDFPAVLLVPEVWPNKAPEKGTRQVSAWLMQKPGKQGHR